MPSKVFLSLFATVFSVACAHAQFGGSPGVSDQPGTTLIRKDRYYKTPTQDRVRAFEDSQLIHGKPNPPGDYTDLESGKTFKVKRLYSMINYYPEVAFSIAGVLFDPKTNGTLGGTTTVDGQLFAVREGLRLGPTGYQSFELGGFYFLPRSKFDSNNPGNGGSKDLYQIDGTFMSSPNFGFQVAFLGTTQAGKTSTKTMHFLFKLDSFLVQPSAAQRWSLTLGLGAIFNGDPYQNNFPNGTLSQRASTTNYSGFFQGTIYFNKSTSFNINYWHVRDRNLEVTRLGAGFGYAF